MPAQRRHERHGHGGAGAQGVASRRHEVMVDMASLSKYEQSLPIRERDAGLSRRRGRVMSLTDTGAHIIGAKQKGHFVKSDPICKNVYILTEKPKRKLIVNIAQIQRDVKTQFWKIFAMK